MKRAMAGAASSRSCLTAASSSSPHHSRPVPPPLLTTNYTTVALRHPVMATTKTWPHLHLSTALHGLKPNGYAGCSLRDHAEASRLPGIDAKSRSRSARRTLRVRNVRFSCFARPLSLPPHPRIHPSQGGTSKLSAFSCATRTATTTKALRNKLPKKVPWKKHSTKCRLELRQEWLALPQFLLLRWHSTSSHMSSMSQQWCGHGVFRDVMGSDGM